MKPRGKKLFIFLIVLVFIICLSTALYYSVVFGDKNEQITFLLISLFISSFIGSIVFIPSYWESLKDKNYNFATAITNYFLMLTESTIMLLGFSLSQKEAGWYSQWFIIMLYIFFGIHMFSYPRSWRKSLFLLMAPLIFVFLNIIINPQNSIEIVVSLLGKAGYVFTLSLVIAGLIMFFKPWLNILKNPSERQNSKILAIYSSLYTIFILIPGLWYLLPGVVNYLQNSSIYLLLLSGFYFIYTLIEKIRSLSKELIGFISVKKEGDN